MALLDFLNRGKDQNTPTVAPVLPKDIYAQGTLDLADTIAPAALKVGSHRSLISIKYSMLRYSYTP
jgi:hypothetical protein